jgi:hypothetical protein
MKCEDLGMRRADILSERSVRLIMVLYMIPWNDMLRDRESDHLLGIYDVDLCTNITFLLAFCLCVL